VSIGCRLSQSAGAEIGISPTDSHLDTRDYLRKRPKVQFLEPNVRVADGPVLRRSLPKVDPTPPV
jgi:hypothetical protein